MARHRRYVATASLLGAAVLVAQRFFIRSVAATGLAGT